MAQDLFQTKFKDIKILELNVGQVAWVIASFYVMFAINFWVGLALYGFAYFASNMKKYIDDNFVRKEKD